MLSKEFYTNNRAAFTSKLSTNSVAIFVSNDLMPRTADQFHKFRQDSDFLYLTGIDQEETLLILCPNHPNESLREILFIKETSELIATWEGHKCTKEEAQGISGIKNVKWNSEFHSFVTLLMNQCDHCYLNLNEHGRFSTEVEYSAMRFARNLRNQFPIHDYMRSAPILSDLRAIKVNEEIEVMSKACSITEKAFRRILNFVKPGVTEYEIEAEITHEFKINQAKGFAYDPIIASGGNACVLHYVENSQPCHDGDLILLDFGADYINYASDLSRTIPVNGRFTERQKDVYNAVLRVMKNATKMLIPGTTFNEYNKQVGKWMEAELIQLGLLDKIDVGNQDSQNPLYKKYFMHGTSHFIGLDTHDVGDFNKPMQPGNVFTCEPGIYIKEENIGIRLENDILITNEGPKDLMASIPIEIEEIEDLMNA